MGSFEQVQAVGAIATKEYSMLKTMEKMEAEWSGLDFRVMPYKDTGASVVCSGHRFLTSAPDLFSHRVL